MEEMEEMEEIEIKYEGKVIEEVDSLSTSLELMNKYINNISKIEGLDKLVNLNELSLIFHQTNKIEGLDNLVNLDYLNLSYNQISKIEGLDKLVNLNWLRLDSNQISKIEEVEELVEKLPQLKRIDLFGNPLKPEEVEQLKIQKEFMEIRFFDYDYDYDYDSEE